MDNMNSKTAQLIKEMAHREAIEKGYPFNWTYKELKRLWNKTPKNKKATVFE